MALDASWKRGGPGGPGAARNGGQPLFRVSWMSLGRPEPSTPGGRSCDVLSRQRGLYDTCSIISSIKGGHSAEVDGTLRFFSVSFRCLANDHSAV
jgi:hypothetical protein